MKPRLLFPLLIVLFLLWAGPTLGSREGVFFDPQLSPYTGKSYEGKQDPAYIAYDQALREYMVKRIQQEFGIRLDPKDYSGFQLLEIEALLKCKKAEEPISLYLKMFPKGR
jgi:hypothetical protein